MVKKKKKKKKKRKKKKKVLLITTAKYSRGAAQRGRTKSIGVAPRAAAIQSIHDPGAQLYKKV